VALVLTAAVMVLVSVVAAVLTPHTGGTSSSSRLLQHQLSGLANPFDPQASSLLGHVEIFRTALSSAPQYPFGRGIGVISMGVKFGGTGAQTEADLSNVAVAFGPLGVVVFLSVLVLGLVRAYRVATMTRAPLALAALGILIATGNQWLNGGMYAIAWLPWLVLGWLDRPAPVRQAEGNAR
jgi:hypothetical protein